MNTTEKYDVLVLGGGTSGKLVAWTMAKEGKRTAVVDRKYVGGSCPNIACLPSKNVMHSAKVASLVGRHREFGIETGPISIEMAGVYERKRKMVDGIIQVHMDRNLEAGDEHILGDGTFFAPRTLHVALRDGGERTLTADRVFIDVGTHAAIGDTPGLKEAKPMTHIEALDLQRCPDHVIVLGGGYVGLELGQALRRLGSRVTIIDLRSRLASNEDADVWEGNSAVVPRRRNRRTVGHTGQARRGTFRKTCESSTSKRGQSTNCGGNRHSCGDWTYAEHQWHRIREGGNRGHGKGPHPSERSAGNNRGSNVWAMGECAGSPYFTHVSEDDFDVIHKNLNGGHRSTKDPAGSGTSVSSYRSRTSARSASTSQRRGKKVSPIALHPYSSRRCLAGMDDIGETWAHEDADRREQRPHSRVHGLWARGRGTDGYGSSRDAGRPAIHDAERYHVCASHDDGGPEGLVHGRAKKGGGPC